MINYSNGDVHLQLLNKNNQDKSSSTTFEHYESAVFCVSHGLKAELPPSEENAMEHVGYICGILREMEIV